MARKAGFGVKKVHYVPKGVASRLYIPQPRPRRMNEVNPRLNRSGKAMYRRPPPHISENELYLKLFITNGGGW
ncbi:MAG: hypothetical protein WKF75_01230 [Singulisphaera sp.]